MSKYMLSIDQGTTSSRAMIFREDGTCVASAQETFDQHYPKPGWVEHDPEDLWRTVCDCIRQALAKANIQPGEISGIGITNQRETTSAAASAGCSPLRKLPSRHRWVTTR